MLDWIALTADIVQILIYPAVWLYNRVNAPFDLPDCLEFDENDNDTFRIDD